MPPFPPVPPSTAVPTSSPDPAREPRTPPAGSIDPAHSPREGESSGGTSSGDGSGGESKGRVGKSGPQRLGSGGGGQGRDDRGDEHLRHGGRLTRRTVLGGLGIGIAAAGGGLAAGIGLDRAGLVPQGLGGSGVASGAAPAALPGTYPFFGLRQAGIVTPAQDKLHFVAFDVTTDSRDELIELLKDWTAAAARLTQGLAAGELGPTSGSYEAPPDDTGEAIGLPPARLTLTFGFGPTLFDKGGVDRFGLKDRQPPALKRLPHFPGDALEAERCDGDLCIQACSDDPQIAVHAVRNLARIGFGRAAVRWSQLGFGRTSSTSTSQLTPRNLFGFKDGTMNLKAEEPDLLSDHVWVKQNADEPAADWLVGGSYLVARRISMNIETWDRQSLREQEDVIGRTKAEGAPLSGGAEFTQPDFALLTRAGQPLVPTSSHVSMAHPDNNDGVQLLRRGFNFVSGSSEMGRLDAGLFFIAFVTDPRTHFIPMQTKLSRGDSLSEYIRHTGSALFAVPPGTFEGEYVGQTLFSSPPARS